MSARGRRASPLARNYFLFRDLRDFVFFVVKTDYLAANSSASRFGELRGSPPLKGTVKLMSDRGHKAAHVALALPGRLVGDFGPVVGVAAGLVDDGRHDDPVRGAFAPVPDRFVRDGDASVREEVFDVAETEGKR